MNNPIIKVFPHYEKAFVYQAIFVSGCFILVGDCGDEGVKALLTFGMYHATTLGLLIFRLIVKSTPDIWDVGAVYAGYPVCYVVIALIWPYCTGFHHGFHG